MRHIKLFRLLFVPTRPAKRERCFERYSRASQAPIEPDRQDEAHKNAIIFIFNRMPFWKADSPVTRLALSIHSRFAFATCTPARSYSESYDEAGRTPVPGPRRRRGCANVRTHLADVASRRVKASRSTKPQRRRNVRARLCAEDFAEHWAEADRLIAASRCKHNTSTRQKPVFV
jgi:hypothetical protein